MIEIRDGVDAIMLLASYSFVLTFDGRNNMVVARTAVDLSPSDVSLVQSALSVLMPRVCFEIEANHEKQPDTGAT